MYFYTSPLLFMLDLHLPLSNESVLAPATSSVPLATTELRIGRRAEILFSCWQLVFDAPVAKFYTLLLSFSFLIATLHIITFLLILSLVYFSQLRVKSNFPSFCHIGKMDIDYVWEKFSEFKYDSGIYVLSKRTCFSELYYWRP